MKKMTVYVVSLVSLLLWGCGTGTSSGIDPNRGFDMWEYMTSTLNYEVEYAIYEDGTQTDYSVETHKMYTDEYVRKSNNGITTLYLQGNIIFMREPSNDVTIERYVYLGDQRVFQSSDIQLCSVERFYENYTTKGHTFNNVLMIGCTSKSGVEQQFYYGYNEGIVSMYENDGGTQKEWVKVAEKAIF